MLMPLFSYFLPSRRETTPPHCPPLGIVKYYGKLYADCK